MGQVAAQVGKDLRRRFHLTPERLFPAHGQPLLEDGTVDVRALCARWDAEANKHAGPARKDEG